jgi:membrane-bound metal-dependent hydrolase YbcI (DUF457 family)
MFIGHFAVGFAVKKYAPRLSLGWLFLAVQFLDLLWPTFLLLDVEHVAINHDSSQLTPLTFTYYPFSHSLVMALVWSFLFGMIFLALRKNFKYACILALCVFSHWVLDFIVHYPDLPLYPGNSPKVGLKLWSLPVIENTVEIILFIIGVFIYLRATAATNKTGVYALWTLIVLLLGAYAGNIVGQVPADLKVLAWSAQLMWVFVVLAFWADHNRRPIVLDPVL